MNRERFGNFVLYSLAIYGFIAVFGTAMFMGAVLVGGGASLMMTGGSAAPDSANWDRQAPREEAWAEMAKDANQVGDLEDGLLGLRGAGEGGGGYGGGLGIGNIGAPSASSAIAFNGRADSASKPKGNAKKEPESPSPDDAESSGERLRQWFPEAFLWRPLVETDAGGVATVPVRVPDQLTTWRVLALAHTRGGAQAGDVATFDSRLDVYVDPVVPAFLYAGDRVELPIQVVNTTDHLLSTAIDVTADGALTGRASGTVNLPAGGSAVQRIALQASGAGPSHVTAVLADADAAVREIPVSPRGRPVQGTRGGTVSDRVTFALAAPVDADVTTQELQVRVFAGPLAVLQAEIERGGSSGGVSDAAYGFALARHVMDLSLRTNVEVDDDAVRRLRILAWQRVVRYARSPDTGTAADLLASLRGTTGHPQAEELAQRMERTVVQGQRADGTWSRSGSGSIRAVLVETAFAARTLSPDQTGARTRATGALRRNLRHVDDAYTAAVVLSSGLLDGDDAAALRKIVTDAAADAGDGRKTMDVPPNAINPWGWAPSKSEMLAWTVLALPADVPWRADLVGELMSGYDASWGFRAGPADVVVLDAVSAALPGLDKPVDVILSVEGREVARKKLDPTQPKLPAVLDATGLVGSIELAVSPPVPGLAYSATLRSWVPWTGAERLSGVDVEVESTAMSVGQDATLTFTLAAPSRTHLALEQGLAAGASVDEDALAALSDRVVSYEVKTDRVRLVTRDFQAGEIMSVPLVVRPAFAGTLTTSPLIVQPEGDAGRGVSLPPLTWTVAP